MGVWQVVSLVITLLRGNKTYLVTAAMALVPVAVSFGWIDQETANWLLSLLTPAGIATLRAGVAKGEIK